MASRHARKALTSPALVHGRSVIKVRSCKCPSVAAISASTSRPSGGCWLGAILQAASLRRTIARGRQHRSDRMAKRYASARTEGWPSLFDDPSWTRVRRRFPSAAYSEFMPPPRIGQKPYGTWARSPFIESDPWGWRITAHETDRHLRPGLETTGSQLRNDLVAVAEGHHQHNIGEMHLADNPYWPKSLRERAASLTHERFLVLSPLALSLTQDDKGHRRARPRRRGRRGTGPSLACGHPCQSAR